MKIVDFASAAVVANLSRLEEDSGTAEGERVCCACRKPISAARTLESRTLESRTLKTRNLESRNLTPREIDLVDLVCQGRLNKEIAYQLELSEGTVKEYLYRLYRKLGVRNRTELVILALSRATRTASAA